MVETVRWLVPFLLSAAALLACRTPVAGVDSPVDAGLPRFDYDARAVSLEIVEETARGDVSIRDVRYPSPVDGSTIAAYLVLPKVKTPRPAILFVHWYEPKAADSNRTQFLDEAVLLARQDGVVGLLVETMWSEPTWYRQGRTLDTDFEDCRRQTIELRGALDVLEAHPSVDPKRIGFVGHDFGAMFGAILAAVDRRARFYALIAGAPSFNDWMLFGVPKDRPGLDAYREKMSAFDPHRFAARAAPAALSFQFGTEDFYTPPDRVDLFYERASEPKQIRRYASEHGMRSDQIRDDRLRFVREELRRLER